jgi:predicted transcriptional regulator
LAKFPNVIGLRLTDEDVAKLDRLAMSTFRQRADVLRCLIAHATASETTDLTICQVTSARHEEEVTCGTPAS